MITGSADEGYLHAPKWRNRVLEIGALVLALALLFTNALGRIDLVLYDWLLQFKSNTQQSQVVLVTIEEKSLQLLGRWPWPRELHGRVLDNLSDAGAAAIGIDLLLSERDLEDPASDQAFSAAIARSGRTVLAMAPAPDVAGRTPELLPVTDFAIAAASLGHVDLEIDRDGVIRRVYLFAGWQASRWPNFALALAQIVRPELDYKDEAVTQGQAWTRRHPQMIAFTGGAGTIPSLSYADVLEGEFDRDFVRDKVVIIGVTAAGMGDRHATPFSGDNQNMPGAEINAHIVNSLVNGDGIYDIGSARGFALGGILLLLSSVLLLLSMATLLLPVLLLLLLLTLSVSAGLLLGYSIWFGPSITLILQLCLFALASLKRAVDAKATITTLYQNLYHDLVTGLPNPRVLRARIASLIVGNGSAGPMFPLVMISLGKFKGVNDLMGSRAGDKLLVAAAARITNCLEETDVCARIHGAEFAIVLPGANSNHKIMKRCNGLLAELSRTFMVMDEKFNLPVSIGVAVYPGDGTRGDDLFDYATAAMHRAEEQPDHGVCLYSRDITQHHVERSRLENDLAVSLERGEIEVHYQPQVSARSGQIIGVEALARWRSSDRGLIQPDDFIPVAESTGLIVPIGDWILHTACKQARIWHDLGHTGIRVAVNLSAVQFAQDDLVDRVAHALADAGLTGEFLELELTESCLMEDMDSAIATLTRLKDMNVALSIDDFGTGYSSLSYLKHFPMDRIKIDKAFVTELHSDQDVREITLAIIAMAHSLNMTVIAEGVECGEQQIFLDANDCEELQGYFFGKPVPEAELTEMLVGAQAKTSSTLA